MAAPSFSSFQPPSFSSFPDLEQGPSKRGAEPSRDDERRTKRSRDKDKDREHDDQSKKHKHHKSHRKDRHTSEDRSGRRKGPSEEDRDSRRHDRLREREKGRDRDDSRDPGKSVEMRSALDDERLKEEEDRTRHQRGEQPPSQVDLTRPLFYSDKKGDALNVRYGGLYAGDVPKYRLVGWGKKVLGLPNAWTAVHRSNRGIEVTIGGKRKMPSITDRSSRDLLNTAPSRRLVASAESARKYTEIDGVIKLPTSRRRQAHNDQSYRDIELPNEDADSDFDSSSASEVESSEDEEAENVTLTAHQEKTKALEQQLKADSSSVSTWLALLSHNLSQVPITSKNAIKARSEITISILARALKSIPKSTRLRLRYLQAGEAVWHANQLTDEWEAALKDGDPELWHSWADWRIRKNGGIDGIVEDAQRVLERLKAELDKLRILWRIAVAFRHAGFIERAMAMMQAQAELTFHLPSSLAGLPLDARTSALEEFWESEVPRIGEANAQGWAAWLATGQPEYNPPASSQNSQPSTPSTKSDPFRRWAQGEVSADKMLRPPLRSTDPEADDDPYATILFTDIQPFLCSLTSTRAKHTFRLVWLSFLGLHLPGLEYSLSSTSENLDDTWCENHLTSPYYLSSLYPSPTQTRTITAESHAGVLVGPEEVYEDGFAPVKNWGYRVVGPLDSFGRQKWGMWTKEDVQGVDQDFVRRVFEQCRLGQDDVEWDVLALAFEAVANIKGALKLSQSFLDADRDSLPRWAAHARLERRRGKADKARQVYQTVLSTVTPQNRLSAGPLWWDWAEMEWLAGHADAAMQVIMQCTGLKGGPGAGGVVVLRARRVLEDTVKEIPPMLWKVREAWVKISALLELLSATSTTTFPAFLSGPIRVRDGSEAEESSAVASLHMLYNHVVTLKSTARPGVLRQRLEQAVRAYPNNTAILAMFLEVQKGQGVWGKVRELIGEDREGDEGEAKSVARRVADVWLARWEKGRWEWEIERTRSGLNAAMDNERTRGSAVLWRLFVEFEIQAGQLKRAKDVLFRAIAQCPGVKELYLLAFDPLRDVFAPHELHALGETMVERGIRMRSGLDEALAGIELGEGREEDENSEEDEIEYNARELRRLKPY